MSRKRKLGPKTPNEIDRLRRFARGFVHTLNNYLSAASGYHQLIQMHLQSPPDKIRYESIAKFVGEGETAIAQAGKLLRSVAHWARPMRIATYEISLPVIVSQIAKEVEASESDSKARFNVRIPDDLPKIRGDANLVGFSLQGIFRNAVRATEGKEEVLVSVSRVEDPEKKGTWFQVIAVKDAGPGIDERQIDYLWIPVAASYKPSSEGTLAWSGSGLGLPMAFLVAEVHGGRVELELPDDGKGGTTVSVYLPENGPQKDDE